MHFTPKKWSTTFELNLLAVCSSRLEWCQLWSSYPPYQCPGQYRSTGSPLFTNSKHRLVQQPSHLFTPPEVVAITTVYQQKYRKSTAVYFL